MIGGSEAAFDASDADDSLTSYDFLYTYGLGVITGVFGLGCFVFDNFSEPIRPPITTSARG